MKNIIWFLCIPIIQPLAFAVEVSVGGTELDIPAPFGFETISEDDPAYGRFAVPPTFERLAVFAPLEFGKSVHKNTGFVVQVLKAAVAQPFTNKYFNDLKRTVRAECGKSSNPQVKTFEPHYESERAVAFSEIITSIPDGRNTTPSQSIVCTASIVHLRSKILFLYAYAEMADLDWTRETSKKWVEQIIAANPSSAPIAELEAGSEHKGFDWVEWGVRAVFAAIFFGGYALLASRKKRKAGG